MPVVEIIPVTGALNSSLATAASASSIVLRGTVSLSSRNRFSRLSASDRDFPGPASGVT